MAVPLLYVVFMTFCSLDNNYNLVFSFTLDKPSLRKLADASEAYLMTQLERGFHTLDFYKSLHTETMTYDRTT